MKVILGRKLGISQIFDKDRNVVPVTIVEAGPCFVTQIKTKDRDNYEAIQIGFDKLQDPLAGPLRSEASKAGKKLKKTQKKKPYRYLREFRFIKPGTHNMKKGDKIDVSTFEEGDIVKVSGISKGKGFQGVVKRHGFSGGPASHGHRHVLRTPGSIGSAFPQRVMKGKKMPGHAGAQKTTTSGLKIAKIDKKNNLLALGGAIPGPNGGLIEILSQK